MIFSRLFSRPKDTRSDPSRHNGKDNVPKPRRKRATKAEMEERRLQQDLVALKRLEIQAKMAEARRKIQGDGVDTDDLLSKMSLKDLPKIKQVLDLVGATTGGGDGHEPSWKEILAMTIQNPTGIVSAINGLAEVAKKTAAPVPTGTGGALPSTTGPRDGAEERKGLGEQFIEVLDGKTPTEAAGVLLGQPDPGVRVLCRELASLPNEYAFEYLDRKIVPQFPEMRVFREWLWNRQPWFGEVLNVLRARLIDGGEIRTGAP